jgi:tetratricopeptide (TPR) repeat protein
MVGPIRWFRAFRLNTIPPTIAPIIATIGVAIAQDAPSPKPDEAATPKPRPDVSAAFNRPGDDPPLPFVPKDPQTVEDRKRIESIRLFTTARALEDRLSFAEAANVLQEAFKLDPDSVAIARRLSRLYVGPLGRPDDAVKYGKIALAAEPSDTETLERLFAFFVKRKDFAACETLLKEVLANPKLAPHAPGRLVALLELGRLYSGPLDQVDKAADAYTQLMAELDDKAANRLSPGDLQRILGNDPAETYMSFGVAFLAAKREDLAIRALEHGLVYDEANPQIPLLLADTLLKSKKGAQALALVERYIKRQPQGIEAYELLSKVLKELKQEDQITPRLEAAAKNDSKNIPLQYVLADRYRETGQVEKAEELYKSLLKNQPTPQTYRALAASLLKRRKAGDLLKVICEAVGRPQGLEAVMPQLQAAASDDSLAEEMLDEGLKQLSATPPELPPTAFFVLSNIANPDRGSRKEARLERLLKLQRLMLDRTPNPKIYIEIADTQQRMDQYGEAAATLEQMMEKYPNEKNSRYLSILSSFYRRAGKTDKALDAARQAVAIEPNDPESQSQLADLLGDLGKLDEAIPILEKIIKAEQGNPMYEFRLGGLLTKFGRNAEAVKLFQDMLKRYGSKDDLARMIHSSLSVIYVNQGDYSKGEAELESALERFPDDAGVNNDLGYLYADQGKNLEKAEAMIRKALKEDPENYAYLDSLGWVLFKRGKVKEAVEPLEKAVEIHKQMEKRGIVPPDATLPEHLGDVFLQLQEVDKARASWLEAEEAAAKSIPPDKRLAEIRKKLGSLGAIDPAPKASTSQTP